MLAALIHFYLQLQFAESFAILAAVFTLLTFIVLLSIVANFILKRYIVRITLAVLRRAQSNWEPHFRRYRVFTRLSHLAPALLIYELVPTLSLPSASWTLTLAEVIRTIAIIYMILAILWFLLSLIDAIRDHCQSLPAFKTRSLRGYAQVIKIVLWALTIILVISQLLGKSPLALLTGLGALSAVLLLVFKDTILGFVSHIQVAAYDLVRVGDWVTIPSEKVDGDIMEISINTVKIRNFDQTITTIPTYALVNSSMQNWRGMTEAGGRRIKRSINIDMDTIRFCDEALLARLAKLHYLKDHLALKHAEIAEYNKIRNVDKSVVVNGRHLTNVGLYRAYVEAYLRDNPKIHRGLTFLVRQLQPAETGLPLEIYVFTNDTRWVHYEGIQADIFDHLLAALPEFGLRAFQAITGRVMADRV